MTHFVPGSNARRAIAAAPLLAFLGCAAAPAASDGAASAPEPSPPGASSPSMDAGAPSSADAGAVSVAAPSADAGGSSTAPPDASGCTTDSDCNHGQSGQGVVCSSNGTALGTCIAGCHATTDCPPSDVCDEHASPHWACVSADAGASAADAGTLGDEIAKVALANVGEGACSTNTGGEKAFGSSCTGNGGEPEYWCADFALWVWSAAGVKDVTGLTAAAGSFYVYGQDHGTLSSNPSVGDAIVFDYQGGGVADHVAIVTQVSTDGSIETVSGDWGGQSGSEATFSSTSSVILNTPAYPGTEGSTPSIMGMTISGFIAPSSK